MCRGAARVPTGTPEEITTMECGERERVERERERVERERERDFFFFAGMFKTRLLYVRHISNLELQIWNCKSESTN